MHHAPTITGPCFGVESRRNGMPNSKAFLEGGSNDAGSRSPTQTCGRCVCVWGGGGGQVLRLHALSVRLPHTRMRTRTHIKVVLLYCVHLPDELSEPAKPLQTFCPHACCHVSFWPIAFDRCPPPRCLDPLLFSFHSSFRPYVLCFVCAHTVGPNGAKNVEN